MTFAIAKAAQAAIEQEASRAGAVLAAIPGVGTGPMGLTPDAVKASPEYRAAKLAYESAFARLRAFNGSYVKVYASELRAERNARRSSKATKGASVENIA